MSSLNKACLIGNLGKDPEIRNTQGGNKVANLRIATSDRWRDKHTGEQKERTEWHTVVIWGAIADIAEKYLRKGSKVYIEGKIQTRKWQDQGGNDRYSTEIVLQGFDAKLVMLSGKDEGGGSGDHGGVERRQAAAPQERSYAEELDDEIPF